MLRDSNEIDGRRGWECGCGACCGSCGGSCGGDKAVWDLGWVNVDVGGRELEGGRDGAAERTTTSDGILAAEDQVVGW
jgi:hypothetical protein